MASVFLIRRAVALVALVLTIIVIWFLVSLFEPFAGSGSGRVTVTIPLNSGVSTISSILERHGVISSTFFFKIRVELAGDRGSLRAGVYELKHGMSYSAVLSALTSRSAGVQLGEVTITPGHSRKQVQALLAASGIKGNYVKATVSSPLLDPAAYGAPSHPHSLEGFLFPDTYQLTRPVKISQLVADQLARFKQEFATVDLSYARSRNLTGYDVLKIASLLSEESMLPHDAPLVASVIYNRLRDNMYLGLDSTVAYATGNYGQLTAGDLASRSPWNTTNHHGLPPTPIDSPDLAAIEAAAHPAKSDYLYFINRVCGNGALRFTASYAQFLGWSADWNRASARAAKHGGSPEFCGKQG